MKNLHNLYMKFSSKNLKVDKILKSRVVLWLLFIIALVNMYAYVMSANDLYIAFMFLTGFIISFFSKNMVVILFWSIAIPNLIRFVLEWKSLMTGLDNIRVREGLEGKTDSDDENNADLIKQANDELMANNGADADVELDDKTRERLGNTVDKMNVTQDKLKKIISKAKDGVENIENREKRDEMKNLIELEENIVDQIGVIGNMLTSIKNKNEGNSSETM
tara:strand:- start:115 stop:774 length:660 start_codon:yes stop_codon:yes gene_type:complete